MTRKWKFERIDGNPVETIEQHLDFSGGDYPRNVTVDVNIIGGAAVMAVTADTVEECEREYFGQVNDGIFENVNYDKVTEV